MKYNIDTRKRLLDQFGESNRNNKEFCDKHNLHINKDGYLVIEADESDDLYRFILTIKKIKLYKCTTVLKKLIKQFPICLITTSKEYGEHIKSEFYFD